MRDLTTNADAISVLQPQVEPLTLARHRELVAGRVDAQLLDEGQEKTLAVVPITELWRL